ncbi:transporter [Mycoplasma hyorhinis]|uniref:sodium:solute symporter family transporter n=1 Tax=Mesomycoplasma hyorhinis TaxID=2100 RepID=UPI00136C3DE5|nr:transporter [Mesomycoplasma hyorhinis]MXR06662.1 transporter [Mesomycoplasma hyorhinis]
MFWVSIATAILFFSTGSVLYTYFLSQGYYVDNSKNLASGINNVVSPAGNGSGFLSYFIAGLLPIGITSLILSAIFASTQSTVSSGLSALANSIVVDFIAKFKPNTPDRTLALISKLLVFIFGTLGILFGNVLISTKQDDLFNYFTGFIGLLNAPTIAVFLLWIFTTKTNWKGALVGFVFATLVGICIWLLTQKFITPNGAVFSFSAAWLTMITFSTTLILGYSVSLLLPTKQNDLTNRAYWTRSKEFIELMKLEEELDIEEKRKNEKAILELQVQVNHLTKVVDSQGHQPNSLGY